MIKKLLYTLIFVLASAHVALAGNYQIDILSNDGGSITINKLSGTANEGELIKVFIHPKSNLWSLQQISVTRLDNEEAIQLDDYYDHNYEAYSFIMPPANVRITAVFERTLYAINVSEPTNEGYATTTTENAKPGSNITISTHANSGFRATGLQVTEINSGLRIPASQLGIDQFSFTLGHDDVTVKPLFEALTAINVMVGDALHGSIDVETSGFEGDTIYVYTNPDLGYETDAVYFTAYEQDGTSTSVNAKKIDENIYSFVMPPCHYVTVNATFSEAYYLVHIDNHMQHGYVSETITGQGHHFGDRVTLTVYPNENYMLNHLTITDEQGNEVPYSWIEPGLELAFNMPYGNVTVHATFRLNHYQIEILDSEYGVVTSNVPYAQAGDEVTLTVSPDMGCMLTGISVVAGYEIQGGGVPHAPAAKDSTLWYTQQVITVYQTDSVHFSFVLPTQFTDQLTPNYLENTKFRVSASFKNVGPQVIWCQGNNTLYFDFDVTPQSEPKVGDIYDGQTITHIWTAEEALRPAGIPYWNATPSASVTRVVFTPGFANARPTNCYYWFHNFKLLKEIVGLENLNTSQVTDMTSMFNNCLSLKTLNVNNFNMSNVTKANKMFFSCTSLTTILCDSTWNIETGNNMFTYDDKLVGAAAYRDSRVDDCSMANPSTGYFTASHAITLNMSGNGTVEVPESAFSGYSISIVPTPAQFSTLESITVTGNTSGNAIPLTENGGSFSFTMPTESVTVNVTFITPDLVDAVIWTEDNATLYFVSQPADVLSSGTWQGHTITSIWDGNAVTNVGWTVPAWNSLKSVATNVVFDSSFEQARPRSCYAWFSGFNLITEIQGLEYLNTSEVTNMNSMFMQCSELTSIDVNWFDVSKVTNATSMFRACANLSTIYCDTTWNIATANAMFNGDTRLVGAVPYNSQQTSGEMANPFTGYFTTNRLPTVIYCRDDSGPSNSTFTMFFTYTSERPVKGGTWQGLTVVNVWSGWQLLNMGWNAPDWYDNTYSNMIARYCGKVVINKSFAALKPTSLYSWFANMRDLKTIEGIEYLNTSEATNMNSMFYRCESLEEINVTSFDVSNITNTSSMFRSCTKLRTIYCNNAWDLTGATSEDMFFGSSNLVGAVPYNSELINGAMANPTTGYFTLEKLPTVIYCRDDSGPSNSTFTMFLTNTSKRPVKDDTWQGLTVVHVWSGKQLLDMGTTTPEWYNSEYSYMIARSCGKVVIDKSFAELKPTSFYHWFANMRDLKTIEGIEYLNTSQAYMLASMFYRCESLKELDVNSFDVSNVDDASHMFVGCSNLETIYCDKAWDLTNANSQDMFYADTKLVGAVPFDPNYTDGAMANPTTGYFTAKTGLPGDANGDGRVNVMDITTVINHILGYNPSPFFFNNADVNNDGVVNVIDITAIINIILNRP